MDATVRQGSRFLAILAFVLLTAGLVFGGEAGPARASYRVSSGNSAGSGTGIGTHYVVTNAHVVEAVGRACNVVNPVSGVASTGVVIAVDRSADLAVIQTKNEIDFCRPAEAAIDTAKGLVRFSFGAAGRLVRIACRFADRLSHSMDGRVRYMRTTVPSQGGDSGGGIFQDGKLVGVLWGTNGETTIATEINYLQPVLAEFDRRNPDRQLQCTIFGGCEPRSPIGQRPILQDPGFRKPVTPRDLEDDKPAEPEPEPAEPTVGPAGPPGKDGADGKDGQDGRGVEGLEVTGDSIVIKYTDGTSQTRAGLGVNFELYSEDGKVLDKEWIPLGGTLRLQQYRSKIQ